MNASAWNRLTEGAIKRLARRYSERLTLVSSDDRGGWWTNSYALSPRREIARAGADDIARYLRLAGPATPGDGRGALLEVGAGAQIGDRSKFTTVAYTERAGLDAAIDRAIETATSFRAGDLAQRLTPAAINHAVQVL